MIHTHILNTRCYGIIDHGTVFQAELFAIMQACDLIKGLKIAHGNDRDFDKVRILSDSQSALQALRNIDTESRLVKDTKLSLNELSKHIDVELGWIKAHVNHKGNEMADTLAKTGTKLKNKVEIGPSRAHINSETTKPMYNTWNER